MDKLASHLVKLSSKSFSSSTISLWRSTLVGCVESIPIAFSSYPSKKIVALRRNVLQHVTSDPLNRIC